MGSAIDKFPISPGPWQVVQHQIHRAVRQIEPVNAVVFLIHGIQEINALVEKVAILEPAVRAFP